MNAILVPFSGGSSIEDEMKIERSHKEITHNLESFYKHAILPGIHGKNFDHIVLVDNSETGKGVDGFKTILDLCGRKFDKNLNKPTKFVNIVDTHMVVSAPHRVGTLHTIKLSKSVVAHIKNDAHPRLVPQYTYPVWPQTIQQASTSQHIGGTAKDMITKLGAAK
jgi:hypothetical protein